MQENACAARAPPGSFCESLQRSADPLEGERRGGSEGIAGREEMRKEIQPCLQDFIYRMVKSSTCTGRRQSPFPTGGQTLWSGVGVRPAPQHNAGKFVPDCASYAYSLKRESWAAAGFFCRCYSTIQYNTIISNAPKVEYRTSNLRRGQSLGGRWCGRWLTGMRCEECF